MLLAKLRIMRLARNVVILIKKYSVYGKRLQAGSIGLPSDDQAIYCNKLTQGGGVIDFPNGCR